MKPQALLSADVLLHHRGIAPLNWVARRIDAWGIRRGTLHATYDREDVRRRLTQSGFSIDSESISGHCLNVVARKPR